MCAGIVMSLPAAAVAEVAAAVTMTGVEAAAAERRRQSSR